MDTKESIRGHFTSRNPCNSERNQSISKVSQGDRSLHQGRSTSPSIRSPNIRRRTGARSRSRTAGNCLTHITLQPSPCYHTSLSLPSLSYLFHCAFAPPALHSCSVLTCSRLIQQPPSTPSSYKLPYHIVPPRSWTHSSFPFQLSHRDGAS